VGLRGTASGDRKGLPKGVERTAKGRGCRVGKGIVRDSRGLDTVDCNGLQ